MPNIKSAVKRMRQNEKRRARNRAQRSTLRTSIKRVRGLMAEGKTDEVKVQLTETLSIIGKAAQKGLIHKNTAARYASRLVKGSNGTQTKAS